jgi:hypothetical protein
MSARELTTDQLLAALGSGITVVDCCLRRRTPSATCRAPST